MRPTPHSWNRRFEWAMSAVMAQMGFGVLLAPALGLNIVGVFVALTDLGFSQDGVGILFLSVGLLTMIALYANGRWHVGPCLRVIGCGIRVIIWGQLTYGVLAVTIHQQSLYLVLFVWDTFLLFEGIQFSTTLVDFARSQRERQARHQHRLVGENATRPR